MLPQTKHRCSRFVEGSSRTSVPPPIPGQFREPVAAVLFGQAETLRTSVPEAAINEQSEIKGRKVEIGSALHALSVHAPPGNPSCTEHCSHSALRRAISCGTNSRHYFRTLRRRVCVHAIPVARLSWPGCPLQWYANLDITRLRLLLS
jgi:hypothetical protein